MRTRSVRPAVRGAIAGAVVVLGAAVAVWWLWPEGESAGETPPPRNEGLIKEATPAKAAKAVAEKPRKGLPPDSFAAKLASGEVFTNAYGYVFNDPRKRGGTTNSIVVGNAYIRPHFKNNLDYQLASFLMLKPGSDIVGGVPANLQGKAFERAFRKSFETPIEISADDPADIQDLKRNLMDVKQDLKVRMDRGEDISTIIADAFKEMQNLALYREEMEKELVKYGRDRTMSEADMNDFVTAANRLLAERGLGPLKMPRAAAARFRLNARKEKEK